jgi:cyclase
MLRTRVIPILLMRNKGLTKTVKFGNGKYIGDPINAVKIFNDKEVDEIVVLDIDASKENRKPNFEAVKEIASECFMPLGYGGGIQDLDDVKKLFSLGVEKVIINSAALLDLTLIRESSNIFGDQSIVVGVDITKNLLGKYQVYAHKTGKAVAIDLAKYVEEAVHAGAGEILLQSVDKDGVMNGYDLKIIQKIANNINVPLVACGGAGTIEDFRKGADAGASALAAGSMFVYHGPHKAVLINFPTQEQLKKVFK